jgi:hypothetical protein
MKPATIDHVNVTSRYTWNNGGGTTPPEHREMPKEVEKDVPDPIVKA